MDITNVIVQFKDAFLCENLRFSFAFLLITFFVVVLYSILREKKVITRNTVLSPLHYLIIGAFISAFCLFFPVYKQRSNLFSGIVDSVISTIRMFSFDFRSADIKALIFGENADINFICETYIAFISIFVPILTVVTALSIFKDTVTQLKYGFSFFRNVHVFSELNEKSICLARDIRLNDKSAKIVFTSIDGISGDNSSGGLLSDAKEIKALLTKKSILEFHCLMHKNPYIYLIDNEETNNVKNGIETFSRYQNKSCDIYVFSTLQSSETFIDSIEKNGKKARINLVNYAQIIAYDILAKYPMYEAADRCNSDTMSVLVIGAGTVGMECIKATMWCSRMNTYKFKLRIIDSECREEQFDACYNDFKSELKKAGITVDYEFCVADIKSSNFVEKLKEYGDSNYIIIATGDDELTINTATKIRKNFIRNAVKYNKSSNECEPVIIPIISNIDYYEVLGSLGENSRMNQVFYPYGCYFDVYKYEVITDWAIERVAKDIHRLYNDCYQNDEKSYNQLSQNEKRSNRASAVHSIYKMKDIGIDLCVSSNSKSQKEFEKKGKRILSEEELKAYLNYKDGCEQKSRLEKLYEIEHDRWSVFQILDGWISWSIDDIDKNNRQSKECKNSQIHKLQSGGLHGCIVSYDKLENLGQKLYKDKNKFIEYDKKITSVVGMNLVKIINERLKWSGEQSEPHILMYVSEEYDE